MKIIFAKKIQIVRTKHMALIVKVVKNLILIVTNVIIQDIAKYVKKDII